MTTPLFRSEIADNQQRLMGAISLAQPVSIYIWMAALILIFGLVTTFLLLSEHHRKERVRGFLVPDKGLLRIHASQPATVAMIHVREGDQVAAGELLVSLVRKQSTVTGDDLGGVVVEQIQQRLHLLQQAIIDNQTLLDKKLTASEGRELALDHSIQHLNGQLKIAQSRLGIQRRRLESQRKLHASGHIPRIQLDQSEEAFLAEQLSLGQLQRQVLILAEQRQQAADVTEQLPVQSGMKANELQRQIAQLAQQLSEVESTFQPGVRAAEAGVITAVRLVEGQLVEPGDALMTVIPQDSNLIAELLLPSRSIGQIKTGDSTRLRFDAFPYQKYGLLDGEILQIDRAVLDTRVQASPEPVYRVRAGLDAQQLGEHPLRSGMLVEADILLEKRRLLDWLLEPFIGFRTRLG